MEDFMSFFKENPDALENFAKQNFKDSLDMVMFLEA